MASGGATAQPSNVFQGSANALNAGTNAAMGASTYNPMNVSAQPINMGRGSVNPFMNPFQQNVTDATMRGLADQQAMTMNNLDAQAGAAGAFGGSRHGVAMGQSNDAYARTQADTLAGLNSQNFMNAQNMAFQTQSANQGANMQAQMANQQAGLAGQGLNLSAAGQLGNLSNLGFGQGMAINNQQASQGAQIQAMNQALINASRGQFGGFTGAPTQSVGLQTGTTSAVPHGQTQTMGYTPGLFDFLSLGMGM